ADPSLPAAERVHIGFALGEAYEQAGDYARALSYFRDANAMHRATIDYDAAEAVAEFRMLKRDFTAEYLARRRARSSAGAGMIFIVGMPRSGTTLAEQILASHPDVHGGGETLVVPELTGARWASPLPVDYGALLTSLGDAGLDALGHEIETRAF